MGDFSKCIKKAVKDGKMTDAYAKKLLEKHEKLKSKYVKAGNDYKGADLAAEKVLTAEAIQAARKERNLLQSINKQDQILEQFKNTNGSFAKKVGQLFQAAAYRGENIKRNAFKHLDEVADSFKLTMGGMSKNHEEANDAIKWLVSGGKAEVSPTAAKMGQAMKHTFDYLHAKYKAAGGLIGKLDNYFPQSHKREAIKKVTKEQWVLFLKDRLDYSKMENLETGMEFTDWDELAPILGDIYDEIKDGVQKKGGRGDLDSRHNRSRFLHFKDADSFLEYNAKFGAGEKGLIQAFLNNVDGMSRDIGALETLGPRPNAMKNFLLEEMEKADGRSPNLRKLRSAEFNMLTSRFEAGDTESFVYKALAVGQDVLRSAMLGSASISAISDTAFVHAAARLNGLDSMQILANFGKFLANDKDAVATARQLGLIADVVSQIALDETRFASESMATGMSSYLSRLTHKLSGLDKWTRSVKSAVSLEAVSAVGRHIESGKTWAELPQSFRGSLAERGMNGSDWDFLVKHGAASEVGGGKFFIPSEFRNKGFKTTEESLQARRVADQVDDWVDMLRNVSTNESTLTTRAFSSGAFFGGEGAGGRGTPGHAVFSTLGLFKSFPITSMVNSFAATSRKFQEGGKSAAITHALETFIFTTIMGGAVIQLKNTVKGKDWQNTKDPSFWAAAALQGGALGLMGDFLFGGKESRFGRQPFQELAGPGAGFISDALNTGFEGWEAMKQQLPDAVKETMGIDKQDTDFSLQMFRMAKRNVPVASSLWYTRLALERLLLDHMERFIDPKFDNRMRKFEREMQKKKGQEFWWKPGTYAPERTPGTF